MSNNNSPAPFGRRVSFRTLAGIEWDIPVFMWELEHEGQTIGICPMGAMSMAAGRPAAGKSSWGRDTAARVSRGTLPGALYGTPANVLYIAAEENIKYNVIPGLIASGADMNRIIRPRVDFHAPDGTTEEVAILPEHDMRTIINLCIEHGVKLVIVDPIMNFMNGIDANRNNEVRDKLKPWTRLAEEIDGVVLAITHLNKSGNGDVVAGITGSSAFGEVTRCALGFTKLPDSDERVMSVEKNSIGLEGAAWKYRIASRTLTRDDGVSHDFGVFELLGESEQTVGEILRDQGEGNSTTELKTIVLDFLDQCGGSAPAVEVQAEVKAAGMAWKTAQNKRGSWGVQTTKIDKKWHWYLKGHKPGEIQSPQHTWDLGTLGPSQVKGHKSTSQPGPSPTTRDLPPNIPNNNQHPGRDLEKPPLTSEHPNIPTSHVTKGPTASNDTQAAIINTLSTTHPMKLGAIMRQVKEATGSGATTGEELDQMESQGVIIRNAKGGYLLAVKETA